MDDAGDEHDVEQGAHRLDAVLLDGPRAALVDVVAKLLVRGGELVLLLLEGRGRGERGCRAEVRVLEVLGEQARGLEVLPGALEPGVVELGRLP